MGCSDGEESSGKVASPQSEGGQDSMAYADEGAGRIPVQGDSVDLGPPTHFCSPCQQLLGPCEDREGGGGTFLRGGKGTRPSRDPCSHWASLEDFHESWDLHTDQGVHSRGQQNGNEELYYWNWNAKSCSASAMIISLLTQKTCVVTLSVHLAVGC